MKEQTTSRRNFLRTSAAATTLFSVVPRHVVGAGFVPPSEQVNVGIIGVGGMGMRNAKSLLHEPEARIAAICDVADVTDLNNYWFRCFAGREPTRKMIEDFHSEKKLNYKCPTYEDAFEMLEREKSIDAVLIATPDHSHAFYTIKAMRMGKHVYCEKPLTHNIHEARLVAKVAQETGVATQLGIHRHSDSGIRMICEWIWDDAIGSVSEVHAWSGDKLYCQQRGRPQGNFEVPTGLNWDKWVGPREMRPYHPAYAPYLFRDWWGFGTGTLGNTASHYLDAAYWALDLKHPTTIEAFTTEGCDKERRSQGSIYTFKFGQRGQHAPVKVCWYDGGLRPPTPDVIDQDNPQQRLGAGGLLFVGTKGVMSCTLSGGDMIPKLLPLDLHRSYKRPAPTLPRVKGGIHADWLRACKGGPAACANFEYGAGLTEMVLLGNVAVRTGKKLQWDHQAMRATNAPEADALITEDYRKGWELS